MNTLNKRSWDLRYRTLASVDVAMSFCSGGRLPFTQIIVERSVADIKDALALNRVKYQVKAMLPKLVDQGYLEQSDPVDCDWTHVPQRRYRLTDKGIAYLDAFALRKGQLPWHAKRCPRP